MTKSNSGIIPKGRVLCLHGAGSSAIIFKLQIRHITQRLQDQFDFVFLDAPFESNPGPDILPFFDGCDPFYSWETGEDDEPAAWNRIRQVIREALEADNRLSKERSSLKTGILGFSEGASLVAGLLKQQSFEVTKGNLSELGCYFDFAILFSPVYYLGNSTFIEQTPSLHREFIQHKVDVPSLHIYGLSDPVLHLVKGVISGFVEDKRATMCLEMSHTLPSQVGEIERVVDAIKEMWSHVAESVA